MRIGMLLDKPFPPDPRVANEARSLVGAGHEVHLLCVDPGGRKLARETWSGVEVHRLSIDPRFYKKASALALVLPFYFDFFGRRLVPWLRRERIEALHVHDLPLASVGLRAVRKRDLPFVIDLHENYPAAVATYDYANRFPGKWLISPATWRRYEKRMLPQADRIIVVVEEAAERMSEYEIAPDRIRVVSNTVAVDEFEGFPRDASIEARFRDRFTLAYLGGFDRHRGLESAVDALALLAREDPEVHLLLVGEGATRSALESRVRELGLAERVSFEGWQSFQKFPSYVSASAVCLIPHLRSEHTDTTIPHKLFHYMLLARPVVATDCRPLRRILEETGAGLTYPSGDAASLAQRLRELRDPQTRARLGERGRRAVLERYNWERSSAELIALYAGLSRG